MKKILMGLLGSLILLFGMFSFTSFADQAVQYIITTVYIQLVNEPAAEVAKSFVIDLNQAGVSRVSAQIVYSTASPAAVTFIDGTTSTGTITISSNSFLATAQSTDTIIISSNTALVGAAASDSISISSNGYLVLTTTAETINFYGSTLTINKDFLPTAFSTKTAQNLATAINGLGIYGVTATTNCLTSTVPVCTGSSVTIVANAFGAAFNVFTLVSSTPSALTVTTSPFSGGKDPASFTFNGNLFVSSKNWFVDVNFATNTAVNIANMLNFSTYSITAATATIGASTGVVLTAITSGTAGNSYTLFSSTPSALAMGTTNFVNGRNAAVLKFNGFSFTNGIDWLTGTTASATARNISNMFATNPVISTMINSTWTANGIVFSTSTAVNISSYTFYSSTQAALTVSSTQTFTGDGSAIGAFSTGTASMINLVTDFISTTNAFTTGMAVLFSTTTGTSPVPLVNQTTYFALNATPLTFQLAFTATGAIAGLPINITTATATGGGSFSLTPLPFNGNASAAWQVSNDSVTWAVVNVSSLSFTSSTLQNSTTYWDFGNINARYLRLNYSTPTAGGVNMKVYLNGKY